MPPTDEGGRRYNDEYVANIIEKLLTMWVSMLHSQCLYEKSLAERLHLCLFGIRSGSAAFSPYSRKRLELSTVYFIDFVL